jgi:hypothetical protein
MFAEARCRSIRFEVSYNSYRQSFLPLWLIKGPTSESANSQANTPHRHIFPWSQPTITTHSLKYGPYDLKPKDAKKTEVESVAVEDIGAGENILDRLASVLYQIRISGEGSNTYQQSV